MLLNICVMQSSSSDHNGDVVTVYEKIAVLTSLLRTSDALNSVMCSPRLCATM
jgi:hypothetical protein